jgi:hypothetical protein
VRLVHPAETAVSRNREAALRVIVPRLFEMHRTVSPLFGTKPDYQVFGPSLAFYSRDDFGHPGAIYFRIYRLGGENLMTGWLNMPAYARAKHMEGKVHIMTWKRGGWERHLFTARQR